jgi:surface antigen
MYKLMGYNVSQTPSVGSMLVYGTHAVYVESMNADGTLNISEANHNNDFSYRTIYPPANGYYVA